MKRLDVLGVRVEMPANTPVVLLRENPGVRCLPIWIGTAEAAAIASVQQGVLPVRPMTHDLFARVIEALGHRLTEARIVDVSDGIFYSELVLTSAADDRDASTVRLTSRTSDAIALALRAGAPIRAADKVLDTAGVLMPADDDEEQLARFRQFLDDISPDDFIS